MVRRKPRRKPLGTIWEISDELWRRIEPILLELSPKKPTGRKVANWRKMLNAIISRLRSGCQWDQLPERYGPMKLRLGSSPGNTCPMGWDFLNCLFPPCWGGLSPQTPFHGGNRHGLSGYFVYLGHAM